MKILISGEAVLGVGELLEQTDLQVTLDTGAFAGYSNLTVLEASDFQVLPSPGDVYRNGKFGTPLTQEAAVSLVTNYMNAFAAEKSYDSIQSAAIRAGYVGPFQAEGVKYATWMDNCWAACYAVLSSVEAGTIPIPTEEELLAQLPTKPTFP